MKTLSVSTYYQVIFYPGTSGELTGFGDFTGLLYRWLSNPYANGSILFRAWLMGVKLYPIGYKTYREGWDHDHCEFCMAKFSVLIPWQKSIAEINQEHTCTPANRGQNLKISLWELSKDYCKFDDNSIHQ
jgi:hypothetical protein